MHAGVLRKVCRNVPEIVKQFGVARHPCQRRSADQLDSIKPAKPKANNVSGSIRFNVWIILQ